MAVVEQGPRVRPGHVQVRADHHALAGGQPVVLDHVGRVEPGQRGVQVRRVVDDLGAGGAHPGRGHHVLGEALGALDAGGRRARAEAGEAGGPHGVGDPGDQRHLRPDHHQVGLPAQGQRGGRGRVQHVQAVLLGHPGRARVAGRAGQRRHVGVLGHGQDDGVLTSTGAHDEDAHDADRRDRTPAAAGASVVHPVATRRRAARRRRVLRVITRVRPPVGRRSPAAARAAHRPPRRLRPAPGAHPGRLRAGRPDGRRLPRAGPGHHGRRGAGRPARTGDRRHHRHRRAPGVRRPAHHQDHRRAAPAPAGSSRTSRWPS